MKKPKPNNETGKYIFLSYPHKNDEQAAKIIEALQAAGYRVWFDEWLELGVRYNHVIAEHIEECEVFMCLLTPEYYQSEYCQMEFTFAREGCGKEIIPVFMGDDIQIMNSFPAGMRMFLTGVNAFMMNERVNINDFMHKISESSILDACREKQTAFKQTEEKHESDTMPKRKPQARMGSSILSGIKPSDADVVTEEADPFEAAKSESEEKAEEKTAEADEAKTEVAPSDKSEAPKAEGFFAALVASLFGLNKAAEIIEKVSDENEESNAPVEEVKKTVEKTKADPFEALGRVNVNDIIKFGNYWQDAEGKVKSSIEWQVLDKTDNHILVISKYALDNKPYHEKRESVTWEACTLRKWLNEEFYNNAFSDEERKRIAVYKVPAHKNLEYDTDPGNPTRDRIFLLSVVEANNYFHGDKERIGQPTPYCTARLIEAYKKKFGEDEDYKMRCKIFRKSPWWWLRSSGDISDRAALVLGAGSVCAYGINVDYGLVGVRPALWLILNP